MGRMKTKSFHNILIQNNSILFILIIVCFIISFKIDNVLSQYKILNFKDDTGATILFLFMLIVVVNVLNGVYSRKIAKEAKMVTEHIHKIQIQDLEVNIGHSKITELEEMLRALESLKNELAVSLEAQWRIEEHKKECIIALGHDMKTPITILKGNSELLSETPLNELQMIYNESNLHNIERIQQYLETLIITFYTCEQSEIKKRMQSLDEFFEGLVRNYKVISKQYENTFVVEIYELGTFEFDEFLLERAVNNVVMNAFSYSGEHGTIRIRVRKEQASICISIEDSGCGFSRELIEHAAEAFFRGDKSRKTIGSELHMGLGLYQTKELIRMHGGELKLSNSDELGGAKVIIRIK